ncbi:hypothetical protein [Nocardioides stalactiti]|uniref:hypothetical protein n=1 Tax=Nocardioides stalactiti TaxID=2755356 RepID=UPI0016014A4F|nr:hypothetical protein [Nocardioides stalactiti]
MAVIKNITPDALSLFNTGAPPVYPGDEVEISDEKFVGLAWSSDTWEIVVPPAVDGVVSVPLDDATLYLPEDEVPEPEVIPTPVPAPFDEGEPVIPDPPQGDEVDTDDTDDTPED